MSTTSVLLCGCWHSRIVLAEDQPVGLWQHHRAQVERPQPPTGRGGGVTRHTAVSVAPPTFSASAH